MALRLRSRLGCHAPAVAQLCLVRPSAAVSTKRKTILICGGIFLVLLIIALLIPATNEGHRISKRQFSQSTMQNLITAADAYRHEYGDWPQGDTARITRTLLGDNPRKIVFAQIDRRFINSRGEPTDAWSTPLKLSFSGERMIAIAAGKDQTFGTADDLTLSYP
jgi:hypothetical protein